MTRHAIIAGTTTAALFLVIMNWNAREVPRLVCLVASRLFMFIRLQRRAGLSSGFGTANYPFLIPRACLPERPERSTNNPKGISLFNNNLPLSNDMLICNKSSLGPIVAYADTLLTRRRLKGCHEIRTTSEFSLGN